MKKRQLFKSLVALIMAAATVATSSLMAYADADIIKNEHRVSTSRIADPQIVSLEVGEASEYGKSPYRFVDSNGNEVKFDLIPEKDDGKSASLPSFFFLDEQGRDSLVGNQSPYNVCWSFATTTALETSAITRGMVNNDVNWSERHLSWFTYGTASSDENEPLYGDTHGPYGTDAYDTGGLGIKAMAVTAAWMGPELESVVPFSTSTALPESYRYHSYAHVQEVNNYDCTDIDSIKQAVYDNGSVYWGYYHDNAYYNASTAAYYSPVAHRNGGHAVSVVGWDDNYSAGNFTDTPPGDGAWIIKNSWGTSFGIDGYFYMSYYDATPDEAYSFHVEPTDNYDDIYQYDGSFVNLFANSNYTTFANVFTAEDDCTLDAVAFTTMNVDSTYTIKVYNGLEGIGAIPESGTLASTRTVTIANPGYHTVDLSTDVSLSQGETFAVVVSCEGGLSISIDNYNYGYGTSLVNIDGQWIDLYSNDIGNISIKAFTKASLGIPSDVAAANVSNGVKITWDAVKDATSYRVYRADSANGSKTLLKTVGTTYCTDTSAVMGKTYYYFVQAYNSKTGELSEYSTAVSITVRDIFIPVISSAPCKNDIVTVKWNKVEGATSYRLYRATSTTGEKTLLKTVGTLQGTDQPKSGTYYYYVKAYNSKTGKLSDYSAPIKVSLITKPVIQSMGFVNGNVVLKWNYVNTATSYRVYRAESLNGARTLIKTVGINSYTDTTATPGKTYYYFIQAYNNNLKILSASSNPRYLTIPEIDIPAISSIGYNLAANCVEIEWDSVPDATSYRVYRATGTGAKSLIKTVGTHQCKDTSMPVNGSYTYYIQAYNSKNGALSGYSDAAAVSASIPGKPLVTSAEYNPAARSVVVKWNALDGATSYRLYRSTSETGEKTLVKTVGILQATDITPAVNTTYYYFVRAYNNKAGAMSDYSTAREVTTYLDAPTNLTAEYDPYQGVKLNWDAVEGIDTYRVYRAELGSSVKTLVKTVSETECVDSSAGSGMTYLYYVRSYDSTSGGLSDYSDSAVINTVLGVPAISSAKYYANTDEHGISLSWSEVYGADSYRIYRATSSTGEKTLIKTVEGLSTNDTTIAANTYYYYYVQAYNSITGALGSYSEYAYTNSYLECPVITDYYTTTVSGSYRVYLYWNEIEGATQYKIYRTDIYGANKTCVATTTSASGFDSTAVSGRPYTYYVRAYNDHGAETNAFDGSNSITINNPYA